MTLQFGFTLNAHEAWGIYTCLSSNGIAAPIKRSKGVNGFYGFDDLLILSRFGQDKTSITLTG